MGEALTTDDALHHPIPYLKQLSRGHHLMVRGQPFLMLPAELHNSSFSCPKFMSQVWPKLKESNVNTVLVNVSWEDIEAKEGEFDFTRLDQGILDARKHGLHLVLLWFGAFKNGKSTYAPRWVKTDPERFPRMILHTESKESQVTDVLSIFSFEVARADSAAFRMLMRHVRDIDHEYSTILMVQVENEVGLLGGSRDLSSSANSRFHAPVPTEMINMIKSNWGSLHGSLKKNLSYFRQEYPMLKAGTTTWPETFGASFTTDELFMAYHYALYVEQVAKAGKEEYPLPLFTNVWQNYADEDADKRQPVVVGGGGQPGDYPSGGGVVNVLDVWKWFAPSLDFIAPDLYLNDYDAVCSKYRHLGQPLFIPEQRRDEYGARRIWSAYATHHALGASPFAIDSIDVAENPWPKHFGLLAQVAPWLLAARDSSRDSHGFWFDEYAEDQTSVDLHKMIMGDWNLSIERSFVFGKPGPGFGMILRLSNAKFLLIGEGFQVRFASRRAGAVFTGLLSFVEKVVDPATQKLVTGRTLNGDETRSGELAIMPNRQPDLGTFPICITVPAKSGIAEVEVYEF